MSSISGISTGSSTLLDMLEGTSTSQTDDIFQTLVQNNNIRCQNRLEQLEIYKSDSTDSKYEKVSAASSNVSDAVDKLTDEKLWDTAGEDYSRDKIDSAIKSFVSAYNTMLSSISDVGSSIESAFKTKLDGITDEYKEKLSEAGITVLDDGSLSVDTAKLGAVDTDTLKSLLGPDSEFLSSVDGYADDCDGIVSKALTLSKSMSGLYNSSSDTVDISSYLSGSAFDVNG